VPLSTRHPRTRGAVIRYSHTAPSPTWSINHYPLGIIASRVKLQWFIYNGSFSITLRRARIRCVWVFPARRALRKTTHDKNGKYTQSRLGDLGFRRAAGFLLPLAQANPLSKSGQMAALPGKVSAFSATRKYTSHYKIDVCGKMAGCRRTLFGLFLTQGLIL